MQESRFVGQASLDFFVTQNSPLALLQTPQIKSFSNRNSLKFHNSRSDGMKHATNLSIFALRNGQRHAGAFGRGMIQHVQVLHRLRLPTMFDSNVNTRLSHLLEDFRVIGMVTHNDSVIGFGNGGVVIIVVTVGDVMDKSSIVGE